MQRFKDILLVIDHRTESKASFEQAADLCKRNQADLTVVDIVEDLSREAELWLTSDVLSSLRSHELEVRENHLKHLVEPIQQEGIRVRTRVLPGTPFLTIIREVLRYNHDLVIMTADGEGGLKDRLFGSTSMHLMRKCPCPVWVVKPGQPLRDTRILAAVDPASFDEQKSALDIKIMDLATSLAERQQAELHLVHAWLLPGESSLFGGRSQVPRSEAEKFLRLAENKHQDELNRLFLNYDLKKLSHKIHLLKGAAKDVIPAVAQENRVDLIVMGTVARTGVAGFFIGNTAENVLNQVNCSVLTVKPDGFVTPVKLDE
jgi:nucleotide-binding universal stress UspA family protein